jgi:hypothetical protein
MSNLHNLPMTYSPEAIGFLSLLATPRRDQAGSLQKPWSFIRDTTLRVPEIPWLDRKLRGIDRSR